MSQWGSDADANKLKKSYIKGFLDISGGNLIAQNSSTIMVMSAVANVPALQMKTDRFSVYTGTSTVDVSYSTFAALNVLGVSYEQSTAELIARTKYLSSATDPNVTLIGNNLVSSDLQVYGNIITYTTGALSLFGDASLNKNASVTGNFTTGGNTTLNGNTTLGSRLLVSGDASFNGNLDIGTGNNSVAINKDVSAGYAFDVSGITILRGDTFLTSRLLLSNDVSLNGRLFVNNDLSLNGNIQVGGNAIVGNNAIVSGDASLNRRLFVNGDVSFNSRLFVNSDLSLNGNTSVRGNSIIGTNIVVSGDASLNSRLFVNGDVSFNSRLFVRHDLSLNGNTVIGGNTIVNRDASLNSRLFVNGDVSFNRRLFVNSDLSLNGNTSVRGNSIIGTNIVVSGDASLNSRLFVNGDVSFNSRLFVNSDLSLNGNTLIRGNSIIGTNIVVSGDASLNSRLFVNGDVSFNSRMFIRGDASLNGNSVVGGNTIVNGDASLNGRLYLNGDASFNRQLFVGGDISLNGKLGIGGDASFNGNIICRRIEPLNPNINSAIIIGSTLTGTGSASVKIGTTANNTYVDIANYTMYGTTIRANGSTNIINNSSNVGSAINIGTTQTSGAINIGTGDSNSGGVNMLTGSGSTGILAVGGDASFNSRLFVGGDVSFNSRLFVNNDMSLNGNIVIGGNTTIGNNVSFNGDVSLNRRLFVGGDVSFNGKLTIDESVGTRISSSNWTSGSLTLSHQDASGASSILFTSKNNTGAYNVTDYAYIQYEENVGGTNERGLFTIGIENDGTQSSGAFRDRISLYSAGGNGFVGVNTKDPAYHLDVSGNLRASSNVSIGTGSQLVTINKDASAGYHLDISGNLRASGNALFNSGIFINETVGTRIPTANAPTGTITLTHSDASGASSILFKSKNNAPSDYAYIQYEENVGGSNENGLLTIGIENDASNRDRISLYSAGGNGFVGVNTKDPAYHLDVSGQLRATSDVYANSRLFVNGDASLNANLAVNTIQPLSSSATLNIATSQTSGQINIGTGAGRTADSTINIGTATDSSSNIFIGNATNQNKIGMFTASAEYFSANANWVRITNSNNVGNMVLGTGMTSGGIWLGTDMNAGQVRIATGTRTNVGTSGSGSLQIGTGSATGSEGAVSEASGCYINFGTGTRTNFSTINIGTGTNTNNSSINIGTGTRDATSAINIGTGTNNSADVNILTGTNATGKLVIGGDVSMNNKLYVNGDVSLSGRISYNGVPGIITNSDNSQTMSFATDTTVGTVNIAPDQTSGQINIGTGALRTGGINIGTGSNNTTVAIGNTSNINTIGSFTISGDRISKGGNMFITGSATGTTRIADTTTTGVVDIAHVQTSGILNIGTVTGRSGAINIGTGSATGNINIGGSVGNPGGQYTIKLGNDAGNGPHITANQWKFSGSNAELEYIGTNPCIIDVSNDVAVNLFNTATTKTLNIGTGTGRTGDINIGTGLSGTSGKVNILTTSATGGLNVYGGSGTWTTSASLTLNSSGSYSLHVGNNNRTYTHPGAKGDINIGTGTATGSVDAVSEVSGCLLNIGTGTRTRYSSINIGTGSRDVGSAINIGTGNDVSGAINIGTGARNYGNVNILTGANATGKLIVGGDVSLNSSLALNGDLSLNGNITFNGVPGIIANSDGGLAMTYASGTTYGDVNVATDQIGGALNIGTAGSRTGAINIGTGANSSNTVNILTGTGNNGQLNIGGNVDIGTGSQRVAINKDISAEYHLDVSGNVRASGSLTTSNIVTPAIGTTINLYSDGGQDTAPIYIAAGPRTGTATVEINTSGSSAAPTRIGGGGSSSWLAGGYLTLTGGPSLRTSLATNTTTGECFIATNQTSGHLLIGTGSRSYTDTSGYGYINIGTGSATGASGATSEASGCTINIGTGTRTNYSSINIGTGTRDTTSIISIGAPGLGSNNNNPVYVNGLRIRNGGVVGAVEMSGAGGVTIVTNISSSINIGTNLTNGQVNISTGSRTSNGAINIGTGADVSGAINIGTGARNYGDVNILTGANATGKLIVGGDASFNNKLSVSGDVSLNGNIFIGGTGTGIITGNLDIGTGSQLVAINKDISAGFHLDISGNVRASGVATFDTIESIDAIANPSIFSNITNGSINIGTATNRQATINIGTGGSASGPVIIGGGNATWASYGNMTLSSGPTWFMNFATNQTTGNLNIGTGSRSYSEPGRNGSIFIGTGSATGAVGATSDASGCLLNIGTGTRTNYSHINIGTGARTQGSVINIGTNPEDSSSVINIGQPGLQSSNTPVYVNGLRVQGYGLYFNYNTSFSGASVYNTDIAQLTTTGNVNIASAQTSGVLNIGTGSARTSASAINIGTSAALTGNINIGTGSRTTTGIINIGNTTSTGGNVNIGRWNYNGSNGELRYAGAGGTIGCLSSGNFFLGTGVTAHDIHVGNNLTTGNLEIGAGANRSVSSLINIGTGDDVSGAINIGTGARNYGDVNILTGANATGKLVVGGDASLNGNLRVQSSIAINKDISSQYVLDVNGISQFRGNVDVGGSFTINGVAVNAGSNLTGNVQVGTDNGYVTVDKPQFYSDPSLFIYYNFDTSYNNGARIYNSGYGGSTYDACLNANPGTSTTLGVIDTTLFKYGGASLKNDPNTPNNHGAFTYNVPISTKMSVSFWINKKSIPSSPDWDRVFEFTNNTSFNQNENNTIALDISSNGYIYPVITNGSSNILSSVQLTPFTNYNICDNSWNLVTWTLNDLSSNIYINGAIVQTDSLTQAIPDGSRDQLLVAYYTAGVNKDFSGNIDDFRYYKDKVLSQAEIFQLRNNYYYNLDVCGGMVANGSSLIYESVGSKATANSGSLVLMHGDASGSSSIMFKSNNDALDYAYIQYDEGSPDGISTMTIGAKNDMTLEADNSFKFDAKNGFWTAISAGNFYYNTNTQAGLSQLLIGEDGVGERMNITTAPTYCEIGTQNIDLNIITGTAKFTINGITAGLGAGSITSNTVFGSNGLAANTTGFQNVAFGANAMQTNTTGNGNSAFGHNALNTNTVGLANTAIGRNSLQNIVLGQKNTAVGDNALAGSYDISNNTAIGHYAGTSSNRGYNNTFLGYNTQLGSNGLTNATAIGANATVTSSNRVQLGNGCVAQAQSFNSTSDYREKKEVMDLDNTFTVDKLRPVSYKYIKNDDNLHIGFIAHEVQEHYPFLVQGEKDGPITQSLNYNDIIGILTKELKDLKAVVRELKDTVLEQSSKLLSLNDTVLKQDALIQSLIKKD